MVYSSAYFHCETCHKPFRDSEEASECELNHIINKSGNRFKEVLKNILDKNKYDPNKSE